MMQELAQQVTETARGVIEGIHTCMPGEIVDVNAEACTVSVLPKMMFKKPDGTSIAYPIISGVPVMFPKTAGVEIAYPVKKGDGCLILIAEQSLDYWMYGQETDTDLRFDLTNAVCIPALSNKPNAAFADACTYGAIVINGDVIINGSFTIMGGIVNLN